MKCDQDFCLNLWYNLKKLLCQDELNPRVRCAFGNVFKTMTRRNKEGVTDFFIASANAASFLGFFLVLGACARLLWWLELITLVKIIVLAIVITRPAKMIVGPIRIRARAGHAVADFFRTRIFQLRSLSCSSLLTPALLGGQRRAGHTAA